MKETREPNRGGVAEALPEWARRALEKFRPLAAYRGDEPDPEMLRQWTGLSDRFSRRWLDLDVAKWSAPDDHVRQCILECAVESAWDLGANQDPQKVIEAVRELDRLNEMISERAGELSALFQQRLELKESYSLSDQRRGFEECAPDPMRLFGAFELALTRGEMRRWVVVARDEIEAFLRSAATQSRPVPGWADLLDEVAARSPRNVSSWDAGDIAVLGSRSNKSPYSPWALSLIGRLDGWQVGRRPNGFLLTCLSADQLATLAEVAMDAPDSAFSAQQMGALIRRYKNRGKKQ